MFNFLSFFKFSVNPNITISMKKAHVCYYCQTQFAGKLRRHQERRHSDEKEVKEAMALKMENKKDESEQVFDRLRLLGDYHHNCNVLQLGKGELIVVRNPSCVSTVMAFLRPLSYGGTAKFANLRTPRQTKRSTGKLNRKHRCFYQAILITKMCRSISSCQ
jgi:hypothetical protein